MSALSGCTYTHSSATVQQQVVRKPEMSCRANLVLVSLGPLFTVQAHLWRLTVAAALCILDSTSIDFTYI